MPNQIKNNYPYFIFFIIFIIQILIYSDYGLSWDEGFSRLNGIVSFNYIIEKINIFESLKYEDTPNLNEYIDNEYGVFFELINIILEKIFDLNDSKFTEKTDKKMTVDQIDISKIKNRYDLGKYLHGRLNNNISNDELNGQGLWTWLALLYWDYIIRQDAWMPRMEAIVPLYPSQSTKNEIGANFQVNQSLEYRHCVRGFYLFYDLWGSKCSVLASKKLNATGDGVETWGSRLFLRRHDVIIDTLYKIYNKELENNNFNETKIINLFRNYTM